jgi:hypothetical protein
LVSLDRVSVERVLGPLLARVPMREMRLVGTASSVLRGIDVPAGDVDVLFRDRDGVDAWFSCLSGDVDVGTAPIWLPEACQYFARLVVDGVTIELSTVEIETDNDTTECFGTGPWQHFDVVPCAGESVPAVATELRLITEVARGRSGCYRRPLIDFLCADGCDRGLIRRGLSNIGASPEAISRIIDQLTREGHN